MAQDSLETEIEHATTLAQQMIAAYGDWGNKIVVGEVQQGMYSDVLDFVNFRMETATSCLDLIEKRHVADALGLCRSLLENYLLLMLMCRGRKFFKLQDATSKRAAEFKELVRERQADLERKHALGESLACLEVRSYPRLKRHLMYIFEGLRDSDDPGFVVPAHYFQFRDFSPEVMRLKEEDYFVYAAPDADLAEAQKGFKADATHLYRHYLSYDALVQCLEINGLVDGAAQARLEAHYTFLGKYLHPTHGAARDLHERSNVYDGGTGVGLGQRYAKEAVLLASLYVCYCLAGLLDEVASLVEHAPKKYIADPATASLRKTVDRVAQNFPYFWFLFNEAPLYDKLQHAVNHLSEKDLAIYGHYSKVPSELVAFNQHIYGHLRDALRGWRNTRWGVYESPLLHTRN